ncbi:MAG: sensor histidine kinase [Geodermatophilaceae bacterium]|nr:sensor histidine kinase [Geodermatophilaceae bacterium]
MTSSSPPAHRPLPAIETLTGIRSSKPTFYAAYRHTAANLHRSVQAIDHIANVMVATAQGPVELCCSVVRAAAEHVGSASTVLALRPNRLPDAAIREVRCDSTGRVHRSLEGASSDVLARTRVALTTDHDGITEFEDATVIVPLAVDGDELGVLLCCFDGMNRLLPTDRALLTILANQAALSLRSNDILFRSERLHRRAATLYAEAERQAADLAERHRQLAETRTSLDSALHREAIDKERHRIARELHDSVAQHVVSAGLTIEWCRAEVPEGSEVRARLELAKSLTRSAVEQLRAAIYAISHSAQEPDRELPDMLAQLTTLHVSAELAVTVRVEGRPMLLERPMEESLFRIASEALFNTAQHSGARRAVIRLSYAGDRLRLSIADDGHGDPDALRRMSLRTAPSGYHRGLANMINRAVEMGGTLQFRRARMGGIRVQVNVPVGAATQIPAVPVLAPPPAQETRV